MREIGKRSATTGFSRETKWLAEPQPERESTPAVGPGVGEDATRRFRRKRGLAFRKRQPGPGNQQPNDVLQSWRLRSIEPGETPDIDGQSRLLAIVERDERAREGHGQGSGGRRCEGRGGQ